MQLVATIDGAVSGATADGLHVFKGIPFAAPSVGKLRWAAPQPAAKRPSVFAAVQFGAQAMQSPSPMSGMLGGTQPDILFAEDCLSLNLWTPGLDATKRPVMVWIHGGAFTMGSGSSPMYDGTALAHRGVVVVSVNYRLGAFGFLRLKDVTGGKIPSTGSEGLLDQVAALRWVRSNIAAFGGDPGNVTIFGESAGGMSVGSVMAMPAAKDLYHKAIPQSGACHTTSDIARANRVAELTLAALGIDANNSDQLYAVPAEELLAAQVRVLAQQANPQTREFSGMCFQPTVDGEHVPVKPIDAIRAGAAAGKAVLVGSTLEESKLFSAMNPAAAKLSETQLKKQLGATFSETQVERLYDGYAQALAKRGQPVTPIAISDAISTDRMFRLPAVRLAEAQVAHSRQVFTYLFDWRTNAMEGALGACHAVELGFVFGTHRKQGIEGFCGGGQPGADALADATLTAWSQFAITGAPTLAGQPAPTFDASRPTLMFGSTQRIERNPYAVELALWEGLDQHLGTM